MNLRKHRGRTHADDGYGGTRCGIVRTMYDPAEAPRLVPRLVALPAADDTWRYTELPVDCLKCLGADPDLVPLGRVVGVEQVMVNV